MGAEKGSNSKRTHTEQGLIQSQHSLKEPNIHTSSIHAAAGRNNQQVRTNIVTELAHEVIHEDQLRVGQTKKKLLSQSAQK